MLIFYNFILRTTKGILFVYQFMALIPSEMPEEGMWTDISSITDQYCQNIIRIVNKTCMFSLFYYTFIHYCTMLLVPENSNIFQNPY
jgi:hypothetical protein